MKSLLTLRSTACTRFLATVRRELGRRGLMEFLRRLLKISPGEFYLQPVPPPDDRSDSDEEEMRAAMAELRVSRAAKRCGEPMLGWE